MSERRELQRKLINGWRYANSTNIDIYNQIVCHMSNEEYFYFLNFLLLLYQNNGIVNNELVNNYILIDVGNREQLRKIEEVKNAEITEEKIKRDEEIRKRDEEKIKRDEEKIKRNEEQIKRDEEQIKRNEERIKSDEERVRLDHIQAIIDTTAREINPYVQSSKLLLFLDYDQLDSIYKTYTPPSV